MVSKHPLGWSCLRQSTGYVPAKVRNLARKQSSTRTRGTSGRRHSIRRKSLLRARFWPLKVGSPDEGGLRREFTTGQRLPRQAGCYNEFLHLSILGSRLSDTEISLQKAGRWFLQSGIQESSGGVARYYRSDLGRNARVSTEITGYTVSALLYLHQRTGQTEYLEAALRAARFLTRIAWDARLGTFPFEPSLNGDRTPGRAYFFDCGIIVRGLLAAWRASKDTQFRDTAIAAGRGMLADFRGREVIHPILSLPDKCPLAHEARWSASPGCYQLKSAMAWYELLEATGEMDFLRAYDSAVQAALANEHDFLPGETNREKVMDRLHAYSYFLEGLLPVLDRPDCAHAFSAGGGRTPACLSPTPPKRPPSADIPQRVPMRVYVER